MSKVIKICLPWFLTLVIKSDSLRPEIPLSKLIIPQLRPWWTAHDACPPPSVAPPFHGLLALLQQRNEVLKCPGKFWGFFLSLFHILMVVRPCDCETTVSRIATLNLVSFLTQSRTFEKAFCFSSPLSEKQSGREVIQENLKGSLSLRKSERHTPTPPK